MKETDTQARTAHDHSGASLMRLYARYRTVAACQDMARAGTNQGMAIPLHE